MLATYRGPDEWIQTGWLDARVELVDAAGQRAFLLFQMGDCGWRPFEEIVPAPLADGDKARKLSSAGAVGVALWGSYEHGTVVFHDAGSGQVLVIFDEIEEPRGSSHCSWVCAREVVVDVTPGPEEIAVGSRALGYWLPSEEQLAGGFAECCWWDGYISHVHEAEEGAGEEKKHLYDIQFTDGTSRVGCPLEELRLRPSILDDLRREKASSTFSSSSSSSTSSSSSSQQPPVCGEADVFISYCWRDSSSAKEAGHVQECSADGELDPRKVASFLKSQGLSVWLDVERLQPGGGLFEGICEGMLSCKCVVAFISASYAQSANCKMELQFAAKTLGLKIFPCVIGSDMSWTKSIVGLLIAGQLYLNFENKDCFDILLHRINAFLGR